jgi:hypothetical protein
MAPKLLKPEGRASRFRAKAAWSDLGEIIKSGPVDKVAELEEWNGVIAGIEGKIEPLRHMPKSDQRDEMLSFFSSAAAQFRYFKDAWRNHVAHMRKDYDTGEGWRTLVHVRDFMELLSTRLHE